MPRLQIDYSNTIVYKIVCKDLDKTECYVGHTTNFVNRKHSHKNVCLTQSLIRTRLYKYIRENGGWENFDMVEVEKYNCKDVNEAHKYERQWIEKLNAKLNILSPPEIVKPREKKTTEVRDADFERMQKMRAERVIKRKQQYDEYERRCKVQRMKQQQKKQNELEELERQFNAI